MKSLALAFALAAALPLVAQERPVFRGATIVLANASGDLRTQILSFGIPNDKVWVGYKIQLPAERGIEICCASHCGSCSLDSDDGINVTHSEDGLSDDAVILYKVRGGAITNIRLFGSCNVNA